ncbi:hypothetical protein HPB47_000961 [Ixodes persulcatus]|uniref:Uncharacterized protein n=1 Tax=Ixodes persulcatus TaxID=34615 RepID=A0AC60PS05_IXOPE|nr:hypothetical protein HPB47_000961 [Ixodes persulcatus]
MILCWSENQGSSIHDHANAHCFMKVLAGQLKEVRFDWPKETEGPDSPLKMGEENLLPLDSVAYINDSLGLHRVENPSHSEQAVSLHLYCPPFDQCLMFDQRTGHKSVSKVTFWSKFGERTPFERANSTRQRLKRLQFQITMTTDHVVTFNAAMSGATDVISIPSVMASRGTYRPPKDLKMKVKMLQEVD